MSGTSVGLPESQLCHFGLYAHDLEKMVAFYTRVLGNHGNAWSIYFPDPEGNRLELYCAAPWYVGQPFGEPLDLTEPAAVIVAKTEAMVRADPTWRPAADWSADLRRKIDHVGAV
jgi:hypothetical protein